MKVNSIPVGLFLLLLAVSGCNSKIACEKFRDTDVGIMDWSDLLKKADKCLSKDEVAALKRQKERYDQLLLGDEFGVGKTVQQVLDDEKNWPAVSKEAEDIVNASHSLSGENEASTPSLDKKPGPWVIQDSVEFVFSESKDEVGNVYRSPDATAFVLSVPDNHHTKFLRFLVTARHVIDPEWAHCQKPEPAEIVVRFNKQEGGLGYETLTLKKNGRRLFFVPDDDSIDLALVLLTSKAVPNLPTYKFFDIPFRILTTDAEAAALTTNQAVMTAGLLPDFPGEEKNYPVFKTGVLSSMPAEPIETDCENPLDPIAIRVWLISAALIQGTSGAPVFTVVDRGPGAEHSPVVLGVQSMAWPDKGVAGVTPASELVKLVRRATTDFDLDFSRGASH